MKFNLLDFNSLLSNKKNKKIKRKENKMKLNYQALNHVLRDKMNDIVYMAKEGKYAVIKAESTWTAKKLFEFLSVYRNNISVNYTNDKITILLNRKRKEIK